MPSKVSFEIIFQKAKKSGVLFDKNKLDGVAKKCPAKCLKCDFDRYENGELWKPYPREIFREKSGCPKCSRRIVFSHDVHLSVMKNLGKDYRWTKKIKNTSKKIYEIEHNCGNKKFKSFYEIEHGHGCRDCSRISSAEKRRPHKKELDLLAEKKNGKCLKLFVNQEDGKSYVEMKCEVENHSAFTTSVNNIKNGTWCIGCGRDTVSSIKYKGSKDISLTYFNHIRVGAETRNLQFSISIQYIQDLIIRQNYKCALSGIDLIFGNFRKKIKPNASLDRIDSSKGYIKGNVQWVDKSINMMKRRMLDAEFIKWCDLISQHAKKNSRFKLAV